MRILDRCTEPEAIADLLCGAESILASPDEAHGIVRIYRAGKDFGSVVQAGAGFRNERPHLTASEAPSVVQRSLSAKLPLTQHVAVGLIVVRRDAGSQPIHFVVAANDGVANVTFSIERKTRLTTGAVELAYLSGACAGIGMELKGVGMSEAVALVRLTVAASMKLPLGESVIPL